MKLKEFIKLYKNKHLEWDNSGANSKYQCVDLAKAWVQQRDGTKVNTGPGMATWGNAKYWWLSFPSKLQNAGYYKVSKTSKPLNGDIAVFDGQYGHVCVVCDEEYATSKNFWSFDQNWPTGATCVKTKHTYENLLGFIRREYVVNKLSNIRAAASTTSKIIDTIPSGTKVKVISKTGRWYAISYNGSTRYINDYCVDAM